MKLPYLAVFVAVVYVTTAFKSELQERNLALREFELGDVIPLDSEVCTGEQCFHHRERRFLGAIVKIAKVAWAGAKISLQVANHAITVVSLSLVIANTATGGCATYPSICSNQRILETLEKECNKLSSTLMEKYEDSSNDYNILREAVINNIKITHTMEEIADDVEKLFNMSEEVDNILSKNISDTDLLRNSTAKQIVDQLVKPVEFRLEQIKQIIKNAQAESGKNVGIHLGILLGTEALAAGFKHFKKLYKQTKFVGGIKQSVSKRLKLTFKTFGQNTKRFFTNFKQSIKTLATNKLNSLKSSIQNPRGVVKSYFKGINLAHTFINAAGVAAGSLMIFVDNKQWREVNSFVQDQVNRYRQYKSELQEQVNIANSQTKTIRDVKSDTIRTFNEIVSSFAQMVNATALSSFYDTNLFTSLQTDVLPENVVLLLRQEVATNENILRKQNDVLKIITDSKFNLEKFKGWIKALKIIVKETSDGADDQQRVSEILNRSQLAFQYQDSTTKQFRSLISLQSLLCVLTIITPKANSYQTYPLSSIKEHCPQQTQFVFSNGYVNEHEALAIDFIVRNGVLVQKAAQTNTGGNVCSFSWKPPQCIGSVNEISESIQEFFSTDPLLNSRQTPTLIDVVRKIAVLFPSDSHFAFIALEPFRDGSQISDGRFEDLLYDAEDEQYECERQAKRERRRQCRSRSRSRSRSG